jgi:hypothetical protein
MQRWQQFLRSEVSNANEVEGSRTAPKIPRPLSCGSSRLDRYLVPRRHGAAGMGRFSFTAQLPMNPFSQIIKGTACAINPTF